MKNIYDTILDKKYSYQPDTKINSHEYQESEEQKNLTNQESMALQQKKLQSII